MLAHDSRFLERIQTQVQKYEQQLIQKEERLLTLMGQSRLLSEQEENEVMSLNFALEKSIDKQSAESFAQFTPTNNTKLKTILDKVDVIIKEVKK
jgi:proline dehydrogenase